MRRGLVIFVLALLLIPLISAAGEFDQASEIITKVIDSTLGFITPVMENIIGDYSSSEFFFAKILLLILLSIIIKTVLDKTPIGEDNKKISLILAIIVSVLAIRFMSQNEFIESVLIPYGTLGIAITTLLPIVIFFYFVHNTKIGNFGRKVFWTIYGIVLFVLWISRAQELPSTANWIYLLSFIAVIIFIFLDKSIHGYFGLADIRKFERQDNKKRIREAKEELEKLEEHFQHKRMSYSDYKKEKKDLKEYIKNLSEE